MGPESFEERVSKKFEGKTVKAPKNIWSGVEGNLNTELIFSIKSTQAKYKWSAVAAVFIAINSLAFHFLPAFDVENTSEEVTTSSSYNALLSSNTDFSRFNTYQSTGFNSPTIMLYPVVIEKKSETVQPTYAEPNDNQLAIEIVEVDGKRTIPTIADVEIDIYPYHQGIFIPSRSTNVSQSSKKKIWAGIEAGAGNFNSSIGGSNALGNVNTQNLAAAVGTDAFVNPTTVVNPQLDNGVATTLGLDFGMKLGQRWSIESGVSYTNVDSRGSASINVLDIYTLDNGDFIGIVDELNDGTLPGSRETSLEIQESYDHEVDLENSIQFTSIPLKAGYFIMDRKMSLRVNAGLSANYFMGSSTNDPNQGIIRSTQNDLFNTWSFDGIGGLELGYSIYDRFNFTIEPNYRYAITPMSNTTVSPSRFIVQTGLRYTLE